MVLNYSILLTGPRTGPRTGRTLAPLSLVTRNTMAWAKAMEGQHRLVNTKLHFFQPTSRQEKEKSCDRYDF